MRLVELGGEQQFFEGEPDLEPPEELAVGEVDEDRILEEGLDNEDLAEEDVDEDVLAWTLEDLVHDGDDDEDGAPAGTGPMVLGAGGDLDDDVVDSLEVEDLEDLEESLDRLLDLRLAVAGPDEDGGPDEADGLGLLTGPPGGTGAAVACGPEEFVCRACFLVRHRSQLAELGGPVCRDCAG